MQVSISRGNLFPTRCFIRRRTWRWTTLGCFSNYSPSGSSFSRSMKSQTLMMGTTEKTKPQIPSPMRWPHFSSALTANFAIGANIAVSIKLALEMFYSTFSLLAACTIAVLNDFLILYSSSWIERRTQMRALQRLSFLYYYDQDHISPVGQSPSSPQDPVINHQICRECPAKGL